MTITFSKLAISQGDASDIDAVHPIVPRSKDMRDSFVPKPGIELEALSALSGILSLAPDIRRLVHRCSSSYKYENVCMNIYFILSNVKITVFDNCDRIK